MIQGTVVERQILVGVTLIRPDSSRLKIEFVADTGFEGALTLPLAAITAVGLPYLGRIRATLADNSNSRVGVHEATVLWNDVQVPVAILAMGHRPLLGTSLLAGCNLNVDFEDNGSAVITPLLPRQKP